jgi:hypothetical protein
MSLIAMPIFSLNLRSVEARTIKTKTDKPVSTPQAAKKTEAEQPAETASSFVIAAPYWTTEDGFVSTIEMKNNRVDTSLTITPVLYPLHGQKLTLDPVLLKPSESRLLNINKALGKKGKGNTSGAVEILYTHTTPGAFGANLTVLNEAQSLIYNFKFQRPDETSRLEGLWWFLDKDTDGFTAMQNVSDKEIKVTPTLYVREQPYQLNAIRLRAHETEVIHLRQELRKLGLGNATDGGIQLASSNLSALVAGGGLMNSSRGFSAPLRMEDPQMLAMHVERLGKTLHAINVPIGMDMPDMGMGLPAGSLLNPIMSLRNVSDKAIRVQPVFKYEIGGAANSFTLPEVELRPQQSKRVELLPYWHSGQIPEMVSWGSLEINYTGKAGSLIAAVSSIDETGTYVFDAKIENRLAAGFLGDYWSVEGDNDTAITIKNITDAPATCQLNLQYDRGTKSYQMLPLTLQAGEARMIDLKHLQMENAPGINGELFPATATFGGLELTEDPGGHHFLFDAVVYNPKTATCGVCGYSCLYISSIIPVIRDLHLDAGASGSFIIQATMCNGTKQDWSYEASYSEDHAEVSTITTGSPWLVDGLLGGIDHLTIGLVGPGPFCGDKTFLTSSSIVVAPKVTSITPARGMVGTTVNVTISGRGFKSGATTVQAGTGITVANVVVSSSTTLTADFQIAINATGGDHNVSVSTGGVGSNSDKKFYVQIPTKVGRFDIPNLAPGGIGPLVVLDPSGDVKNLAGQTLLTNQCGVYRNYALVLLDQAGERITQSYTITENLSNFQGVGSPPAGATVTIPANGYISDIQYVGLAVPNCLGPDDHNSLDQTFTVTINGTSFTLTTDFFLQRGRYSGTYTVNSTVSAP